jgi:hypothetical protein
MNRPITSCNLADLESEGVAPEIVAKYRVAKAQRSHDVACRMQDMLGGLPVYYGDGKLLDLKVAVQKALDAMRYGAEAIQWGRDDQWRGGGE